MKVKLLLILPFLVLIYFFLIPSTLNQTHADLTNQCEDSQSIKKWTKGLFYCHCDGSGTTVTDSHGKVISGKLGGQIICPDQTTGGIAPWTGGIGGWIGTSVQNCVPFKPIPAGKTVDIDGQNQKQCAPTEMCTDQAMNGARDRTNAHAHCKPNPTQPVTCKCQHPGEIGNKRNGRDCTDSSGNKSTLYCGSTQSCTEPGGQCADQKCDCRHKPGTSDSTLCIPANDNRDISKLSSSDTNVKEITCATDNVCVGAPPAAHCQSKGTVQLGKCTCDPNDKAQSKYTCSGGQSKSCDTNQNCINDPTKDIGINCQDNANLLPPPTLPPPPSPPCKTWNGTGQCDTFGSGLGDLATKPGGFIKTLFAILLSFSGGIALLLIIRAGYQIMTSQGKPEQLQQGRDQLIAAIVGLTFLIFSFVILQVIGYDILRVQGFGQ